MGKSGTYRPSDKNSQQVGGGRVFSRHGSKSSKFMTAASAVFSLRVHAKVCQWTSGDALAAREGQCRRLPLANRILQVIIFGAQSCLYYSAQAHCGIIKTLQDKTFSSFEDSQKMFTTFVVNHIYEKLTAP